MARIIALFRFDRDKKMLLTKLPIISRSQCGDSGELSLPDYPATVLNGQVPGGRK
jgi:hypothetical protein